MDAEPTSTIAVYINVSPDGANYNVSSRRQYHPHMGQKSIEAWDRVTDGILTQLVHDPVKFEETALLGVTARMITEITDRNRDAALSRDSGVDTDNIVVFPVPGGQ